MATKSALVRVLEAEVMDAPNEARDYDAMDHGEVNRRFAVDFLAMWRDPSQGQVPDGEILDLGTGTAQIPIVLCQADESARVRGVDMARSMLDLAARNAQAAGLQDRIRVEQADAKKLPYADGQFAGVISNSIVHHIPEPKQALAEAIRVMAAGGLIFIRDLLRPADDDAVRQLVETYTGDENEHQRGMFDASLRAALSLEEISELVKELGFDPNTVNATSDRHWTWCVRLHS
jgi:ubiquinone/menaquinone biosynthesis C-methylase UbiE